MNTNARDIAIRDDEWVLQVTVRNADVIQKLNNNSAYRQNFLDHINAQNDTTFKSDSTEIIDITGKHLCKYCGEVVEGEYEDLLCKECRETFGHALYSEL